MAQVEIGVTDIAAGEAIMRSPRPPSLLARIERIAGTLVEIPAAALVVAEIVILFAGVVARYVFRRPFTWSDDDAEETFQVFDHPTVKVFRNTGNLTEAELRRLLGAGP